MSLRARSLQTKLLLLIASVLTGLGVTIALVANVTIERTTLAEQDRIAHNVLRLLKHQIQTEYDDLVAYQIDTIARYRSIMHSVAPLVVERLDGFHEAELRGWMTHEQAVTRALEFIASFTYADGRRFFAYDKDLFVLAHPDPTRVAKRWTSLHTLNERDALAAMRDDAYGDGTAFTVIYRDPEARPGVREKYLAHYLPIPQWGWVLCTTIRIDELEAEVDRKLDKILGKLEDTLTTISAGNTGYAFLFSGENRMLIHPTLPKGIKAALTVNENTGRRLGEDMMAAAQRPDVPLDYTWLAPDGTLEHKVAYVDYFKALDWYYVYTISHDDLAAPAHALVAQQLSIILAVMLVCLGGLSVLVKRFTQPLVMLTGHVRDLIRNDFRPDSRDAVDLDRLALRHPDEQGKLATAFAAMQRRLSEYLEDLDKALGDNERYARELEAANAALEGRVADRTARLSEANAELLQYERIVSAMPDWVALVDMEQRHLLANEAFLAAVGRSRAEVLGATAEELYGAEQYAEHVRERLEYCLTGETVRFQRWYEEPSGATRYRTTTYYPYRGQDGAISGAVISSRDITDLKEAEDMVQASNEQLRGILGHSPSMISLMQPDGALELVNERFAEMHDATPEGLAGRSLYALYPPHEAERLRADDERILLDNAPITGEETLTVRGRARVFLSAKFPLLTPEGAVRALCHIATDVTEAKHMEMEAMRAAQLASLGELAAGVAHEINNPVNGIINYAQVIRDTGGGRVDGMDVAGKIIEQGKRAAAIVKNLLAYARNDQGDPVPCRVAEVVEDALGLTRVQMQKSGIAIEIDLPDTLPLIKARAAEIQQICINLLSNARHALNARYPEPDPDKRLTIRAESVDQDGTGLVRITIHDHGMGISPDVLDKAFDPFFTTKPHAEGTGLGLSISRRLARENGGDLRLESENGQTRAILELPACVRGQAASGAGQA